MKKVILYSIPVLIFGAVSFYFFQKSESIKRVIGDEERFLVGQWVNVVTVSREGKIDRPNQRAGKFISRIDDGTQSGNFESGKMGLRKWRFDAQDSIFTIVNNQVPHDSVTTYSVTKINEESVLFVSHKDSSQLVQMRYTGVKRVFFLEEMIDHSIWPTPAYKKMNGGGHDSLY
jgi:hypothetical protein